MEIRFDPVIREKAPGVMLLVGECEASDSPTGDELWAEIERVSERIRSSYEIPMINKRPAIAATRAAYKACGKEPNRYRPSAEAMCRRIVKGESLYRTSTLVDIGNLVSIASGYSMGIFDRDRIKGDALTLGVGREGEPYEAIHRGALNIAGMPVLRDSVGGIATPTSDNARTSISPAARRLLIVINIYGVEMPVDDTVDYLTGLLEKYASARNITFRIFRP